MPKNNKKKKKTKKKTDAPKKVAEGLHKTTVGTGEAPSVGLDSMSTQHAISEFPPPSLFPCCFSSSLV
jgi:hypothetical protein